MEKVEFHYNDAGEMSAQTYGENQEHEEFLEKQELEEAGVTPDELEQPKEQERENTPETETQEQKNKLGEVAIKRRYVDNSTYNNRRGSGGVSWMDDHDNY